MSKRSVADNGFELNCFFIDEAKGMTREQFDELVLNRVVTSGIEKIHCQAVDLVENIFSSCGSQLKSLIHVKPGEIKLSAPNVFIELLETGDLLLRGEKFVRDKEKKIFYRGIEIIPNYKMEVVLFHKDYPKILDNRMILTVKLNSAPNI